jgi:hypothetical protein
LVIVAGLTAGAEASAGSIPTGRPGVAGVIVFECGPGEANLCQLSRSRVRVLTRDGRRTWDAYASPSLSADGRRLAFSFGDRAYAATRDLRGRRLLAPERGIDRVSLRRDGRRVLLLRRTIRCPGPPSAACTVGYLARSSAWGRPADAVDSTSFVSGADWLGNDALVATSAEAPFTLSILRGPAYADASIVVRRPFPGLTDPVVSPEGSRVAVTILHANGSSTVGVVSLRRPGPLRPVTAGPADHDAAWSPDGRSLVFVRGHRLAVLILRTKQVRLLGIRGSSPVWAAGSATPAR